MKKNVELDNAAKKYAEKLEAVNPQIEAYNVEGFFSDGAKWQQKQIIKKVKYWFENIGPFVFPENEDTMLELIDYIKS